MLHHQAELASVAVEEAVASDDKRRVETGEDLRFLGRLLGSGVAVEAEDLEGEDCRGLPVPDVVEDCRRCPGRGRQAFLGRSGSRSEENPARMVVEGGGGPSGVFFLFQLPSAETLVGLEGLALQ